MVLKAPWQCETKPHRPISARPVTATAFHQSPV
jgi:hypothetical protein